MATNLVESVAAVNAKADALGDLCRNGYIRFYDGTQPDTPDDPITTQNLVAELRFSDPAFSPATDGVITSTTIMPDEDAIGGNATWCRFLASDLTPILDGSVGVSGCLININSTNIQTHAVVSLSAYVHTVPQQ